MNRNILKLNEGRENNPARRLLSIGLSLLVLAAASLLPTNALAACGSFGAINSKGAARLPMLAAGGQLPDLGGWNRSIVGLWHVIYTESDNNSTFNDTFDVWHADGTEFESAYLAPAGGNVCVGVWKSVGANTVKLHHIGWIFNPSNPTGNATNSFTIDEVNTVSPDGKTYSGTFTFKIWNLDGTFTGQVITGTISATRIVVE
ncbi:hypothetical protein GCM10011507_09940 [Edaphobacter acidisoli]|uniref:Uncharacterized protein n=1 Tax=Edaphobacter acidisoli TaxID=2040573 RepID=A0A916RKV5_9BACT|nr:hypothetical protein [Edaphobacter acidisoli]GGA60411.1 hypothetical protein GCM10011507_09940 [Edaphobacter acidisoli]